MRNRATTPLSKAKVRMSMSKYNLYNLSRAYPVSTNLNVYKQKWKSKSMLRDYHGEQVRERQWEKMFSKKLRSVVPMDPAYLAKNDGTNESAGRGSGLIGDDEEGGRRMRKLTPYMHQTFAPLERRLDVAIFRALFASSARQARQFVVHGGVKVNGKIMRYPGYLLNPGDMFQVEVDRVMFALGQPKNKVAAARPAEEEGDQEEAAEAAEAAEATEKDPEDADAAEESETTEREDTLKAAAEETADTKQTLKTLLTQSKNILDTPKDGMSAKRKQELREFSRSIKKLLSRSGRETIYTDSVEAQFQEIQNQLRIQRTNKEQGTASLPSEQSSEQQAAEAASQNREASVADVTTASDEDLSNLRSVLASLKVNPVDEDKPYATPWAPRDYMSAFTFVPRYLEVNHNICAAVYVRHPVARPGLGEVPTFLSESISANAFAWYLRRR